MKIDRGGISYILSGGGEANEKYVFLTPEEAFCLLEKDKQERQLKPMPEPRLEPESVQAWIDGKTVIRDSKGRFCK